MVADRMLRAGVDPATAASLTGHSVVVVMLRKRALFVGHDEAGQSYARLLSVIATCLQHDVDPERWLADVIIRSQERGSTVEELLPWVWKPGRGRVAA